MHSAGTFHRPPSAVPPPPAPTRLPDPTLPLCPLTPNRSVALARSLGPLGIGNGEPRAQQASTASTATNHSKQAQQANIASKHSKQVWGLGGGIMQKLKGYKVNGGSYQNKSCSYYKTYRNVFMKQIRFYKTNRIVL